MIAAGCSSSSSSVGESGSPVAAGQATTCPGSSSGFSVSLVTDTGGEASPIAAAQFAVKHSLVSNPTGSAWQIVAHNADGDYVRAGQVIVHAIQGKDGTWQVDSGKTCLS